MAVANLEEITRPVAQTSLWGDAWRRLRRNRLAWAASVYLLLLVGIACVGIFYTPYPPSHEGVAVTYSPPGLQHLMGADQSGRDIFSRIMIGAQISLLVGVGTQAVILAVGLPLGLIAGYARGTFDLALSFVINVFYGIPDLLVALILVVLIGRSSLATIIFAIAVTRWMDMARLIRAQALSLREREFVEAARSGGTRPGRIIVRHILPNALGPVIVQATFGVPQAILFEAFLSFLGLGVPPPTPSWGSMASDGLAAIRISPHIVLMPALALSLTLMAFNFLGDGLRDALDPRQRR